jgi:hypothetical protein
MDTNERITLFCCKRHPDESQDLRFLTITQIPDQVRNDGTAAVILTNPPAGGLSF